MRRFAIAVITGTLLAACTSSQPLELAFISSAEAATLTHMLGETPVQVKVTRYRNGGITLVALHQNERTSVQAGKRVLQKYGGTLVELIHRGTRNIAFVYKGKTYSIDPNRIFTDTGIKSTLRGGYSAEVHHEVARFASAIAQQLRGRVIVSLHNNTAGSYSINSYQAGAQYDRDAAAVHVVTGSDPDNFFFVTSAALFTIIKNAGYNVALQSGHVTDDGSLSVYAARMGRTYVNVEAENGQTNAQTTMLEALLADQ